MSDLHQRLASAEQTIREMDMERHHFRECLREVAPLVLSASFAKERYPLAYAECKAIQQNPMTLDEHTRMAFGQKTSE